MRPASFRPAVRLVAMAWAAVAPTRGPRLKDRRAQFTRAEQERYKTVDILYQRSIEAPPCRMPRPIGAVKRARTSRSACSVDRRPICRQRWQAWPRVLSDRADAQNAPPASSPLRTAAAARGTSAYERKPVVEIADAREALTHQRNRFVGTSRARQDRPNIRRQQQEPRPDVRSRIGGSSSSPRSAGVAHGQRDPRQPAECCPWPQVNPALESFDRVRKSRS